METTNRIPTRLLAAAAIAAATMVLYLPVVSFPFIQLDDGIYVAENAHVRAGVTLDGIRWAFTTFEAANWHPLSWISLMADVSLFGVDAGRHHLVNALFHSANAALLFLFLLRVTGAPLRSFLVALLFAFHPLHVESVAWVSERKDVLGAFFGLLAFLGWARYAERPSPHRYLAVFALLAASLMAKPMLVTFPLLLLLLDFWPLRRLPVAETGEFPWSRAGELALEKVPLLLLSVASSVLTILSAREGGAVAPLAPLPILTRVSNALVSCATYAWKTVVPDPLAVFYPYAPGGVPLWQAAVALAFLAFACYLAAWQRRERPWILFGLAWFLVSLLPVIGLVQVGIQSMADRYTYLPLTGLFVILAWGAIDVADHYRFPEQTVGVGAGVVLVLLAVLSRQQISYWSGTVPLFERAIEVTEDNWQAHNAIAAHYQNAGMAEEAEKHYRETLRVVPQNAEARSDLATILLATGRTDEAMVQLVDALAHKPALVTAQHNLAVALAGKGRVEEAIGRFREVVRLDPSLPSAHANLGLLLASRNRFAEAEGPLREALRLSPGDPEAYNNLGVTLLAQGKAAEARTLFEEALRIRPDYPEARANLDAALRGGRNGTAKPGR